MKIPKEGLEQLYQTQDQSSKVISSHSQIPLFRIGENKKVEYITFEKDPHTGEILAKGRPLCSYLKVTHYTRNEEGENWGRILLMTDLDGKEKELIIPMSMLAGDGTPLWEKLLSLGVIIEPGRDVRNLLHAYLSSAKTDLRAICVNKVGWHHHCYILPDKVYGKQDAERYVFQNNGEKAKTLTRKGSVLEWQDKIGKYASDNPLLIFCISLALAAPFLTLLEEENFGIHLSGGSSIGKTTSLHLARSITGNEIHSWRTTDNGAESLCRQTNDALILFDELSEVDGNTADHMAYMLGNGSGKTRANRKGNSRPVAKFNLIFLSSGETELQAKLYEKGKSPKAGQTVRFVEIGADQGKGMGIFQNLHGFESGHQFSKHLKEASAQYCGTIMDEFLSWVVENKEEAVKSVKEARQIWENQNSGVVEIDGQVRRVIRKFGLIAAVGELAITIGLLPWEENEASNSCMEILSTWLRRRGGCDAHEVTEVINRLITFIQEHGNSRFENAWHSNGINEISSSQHKVINRAGFKKMREGEWEYYMCRSTFEKEILKGGDKKTLLKILTDKKYILSDSQGKSTQNIKVPGHTQMRLYVIAGSILSVEGGQDA